MSESVHAQPQGDTHQATLQQTAGWELLARTRLTPHGVYFSLLSLIPITRQTPQAHERFSGLFTVDELRLLRDHLDAVLQAALAK